MASNSILLVDDEMIILKTLEFDLKKEGYNVSTAKNGEEAVKNLADYNYDMVITDLKMEMVDGISVLKAAKAKNSATEVFILTGFASVNSAIDALRLGAADYMLKPYDRDELFMRIENCLKKSELEKRVKLYEDILPICCECKSIRDDTGVEQGKGDWMELEDYLTKRSDVKLTHGLCKKCYNKNMNELKFYAREN